jgi:hypothetical protein
MEKELSNVLVDDKIFIIRGIQVMVDSDLAELYEVETRRLMEQVKRNIERFDVDFMFELTKEEYENLISQNATSSWGGRRKLPHVFTEQGVYMLATVLKSSIAVDVTKHIMRTFTRLKNQSVPYFDIIKRLESLELDNKENKELLSKVVQIVSTMQSLQNDAQEHTKKIGFI